MSRSFWIAISVVLLLSQSNALKNELIQTTLSPSEQFLQLAQQESTSDASDQSVFTVDFTESEVEQEETTVSDAAIPAEPQPAEPQAAEPQAADPQVAEPQTAEPQAAEPQAAEPQAAGPQVAEPQTAEPQATEPQAAEPQAAEPQAAEPQAAELQAAEPQATEPQPAEPQGTETRAEQLETEPEGVLTEAEPEEQEKSEEVKTTESGEIFVQPFEESEFQVTQEETSDEITQEDVEEAQEDAQEDLEQLEEDLEDAQEDAQEAGGEVADAVEELEELQTEVDAVEVYIYTEEDLETEQESYETILETINESVTIEINGEDYTYYEIEAELEETEEQLDALDEAEDAAGVYVTDTGYKVVDEDAEEAIEAVSDANEVLAESKTTLILTAEDIDELIIVYTAVYENLEQGQTYDTILGKDQTREQVALLIKSLEEISENVEDGDIVSINLVDLTYTIIEEDDIEESNEQIDELNEEVADLEEYYQEQSDKAATGVVTTDYDQVEDKRDDLEDVQEANVNGVDIKIGSSTATVEEVKEVIEDSDELLDIFEETDTEGLIFDIETRDLIYVDDDAVEDTEDKEDQGYLFESEYEVTLNIEGDVPFDNAREDVAYVEEATESKEVVVEAEVEAFPEVAVAETEIQAQTEEVIEVEEVEKNAEEIAEQEAEEQDEIKDAIADIEEIVIENLEESNGGCVIYSAEDIEDLRDLYNIILEDLKQFETVVILGEKLTYDDIVEQIATYEKNLGVFEDTEFVSLCNSEDGNLIYFTEEEEENQRLKDAANDIYALNGNEAILDENDVEEMIEYLESLDLQDRQKIDVVIAEDLDQGEVDELITSLDTIEGDMDKDRDDLVSINIITQVYDIKEGDEIEDETERIEELNEEVQDLEEIAADFRQQAKYDLVIVYDEDIEERGEEFEDVQDVIEERDVITLGNLILTDTEVDEFVDETERILDTLEETDSVGILVNTEKDTLSYVSEDKDENLNEAIDVISIYASTYPEAKDGSVTQSVDDLDEKVEEYGELAEIIADTDYTVTIGANEFDADSITELIRDTDDLLNLLDEYDAYAYNFNLETNVGTFISEEVYDINEDLAEVIDGVVKKEGTLYLEEETLEDLDEIFLDALDEIDSDEGYVLLDSERVTEQTLTSYQESIEKYLGLFDEQDDDVILTIDVAEDTAAFIKVETPDV